MPRRCLILFPLTDQNIGEVGKLLGEKWKELSAKEKEPYDKKAKTDKERYEREKAEYAGGVSPTTRFACLTSY